MIEVGFAAFCTLLDQTGGGLFDVHAVKHAVVHTKWRVQAQRVRQLSRFVCDRRKYRLGIQFSTYFRAGLKQRHELLQFNPAHVETAPHPKAFLPAHGRLPHYGTAVQFRANLLKIRVSTCSYAFDVQFVERVYSARSMHISPVARKQSAERIPGKSTAH